MDARVCAAALRSVPPDTRVAFDEFVRTHVPMLFTNQHNTLQVTRLDTLVTRSIVSDDSFLDALRIEIDGFGLSLVLQPLATSAIAGATWIGVLLKLIQHVKLHAPMVAAACASEPLRPRNEADVEMVSERECFEPEPAPLPLSQSTPRNALSHATSSDERQRWHYAVLYRASTHPLPGTLTLKKGTAVAIASENVSAYFPLDDRLVIGKDEYVVVAYNAQTRELELGSSFALLSILCASVSTSWLTTGSWCMMPCRSAVRRTRRSGRAGVPLSLVLDATSTVHQSEADPRARAWEQVRGPEQRRAGSSLSVHERVTCSLLTSLRIAWVCVCVCWQELFQDYQFLNPESDYEVAVKFGPVPSAKDARALADEWKQQCRAHFEARTCVCCRSLQVLHRTSFSRVARVW